MTTGFYTKSQSELIFFISLLSLNIGPKILKPHSLEYPFPFAGQHNLQEFLLNFPLVLSLPIKYPEWTAGAPYAYHRRRL